MKQMILLFFYLCGSLHSTKAQSGEKKLIIKNLTEDFYIYTTFRELNASPFPSNSMYFITEEGAVLIDTPWDTTQTLPLLDSIDRKHGKKVLHCIVTHYHDDRTGGLDILKSRGIKTWSTTQTRSLCIQRKEKIPENAFSKDTVFRTRNIVYETYYPGPGHTIDNIVIWFPEQKILYGGCLVKSTESKGLGNVADSDVDQWDNTIQNLLRKYPDAKYVIPGHFGWDDPNSLEHTLKLLDRK